MISRKYVKRMAFVLVIPAFLFSCAFLKKDWSFDHHTAECQEMVEICANAKEYKKQYRDSTTAEKRSMRKTLKAYENACTDAKMNCRESAREFYEKEGEYGY